MKYTEKDLIPGSIWKHVATLGLYSIVGISLDSTNGKTSNTNYVVYCSKGTERLYHREINEWLDGRFIPFTKEG